VIIFEHDHARKIESMRVYPTDKHTVLFDESEARRCLARACDDAAEAIALCQVLDALRGGSNATASCEYIECNTLA